MFHVGQRVVCVDASGATMLIKNNIYTVAAVSPAGRGIRLYETCPGSDYHGFRAERFRPVHETNIDIFRQILIDAPKQIERETA